MTGLSSSKLSINLSDYLNAYQQAATGDEDSKMAYRRIRENIDDDLKTLGGLFWERMLSLATRDLDNETQNQINQSSGATLLRRPVEEMVKNTMDEAILSQKPVIELVLVIGEPQPGIRSFQLTDNGRGFSTSFLNKTATREERQAYALAFESEKSGILASPLFGGRGRGLRTLIMNVEHLSDLDTRAYVTPKYQHTHTEQFKVLFSNAGGARIVIEAPDEPLMMRSSQVQGEYDQLALDLTQRRFGTKKVEVSPNTIIDMDRDFKNQFIERKDAFRRIEEECPCKDDPAEISLKKS
jgi:hypothetical protein